VALPRAGAGELVRVGLADCDTLVTRAVREGLCDLPGEREGRGVSDADFEGECDGVVDGLVDAVREGECEKLRVGELDLEGERVGVLERDGERVGELVSVGALVGLGERETEGVADAETVVDAVGDWLDDEEGDGLETGFVEADGKDTMTKKVATRRNRVEPPFFIVLEIFLRWRSMKWVVFF
jgi:hypothetical protein